MVTISQIGGVEVANRNHQIVKISTFYDCVDVFDDVYEVKIMI